MLSNISQTEKDEYHVISLICGIEGTKKNKLIENRLINTEENLVMARGEDMGD